MRVKQSPSRAPLPCGKLLCLVKRSAVSELCSCLLLMSLTCYVPRGECFCARFTEYNLRIMLGHTSGEKTRTYIDLFVFWRGTLLGRLAGHSCTKLLWETLPGHSFRTSCGSLVYETLVGHSYRTLLWDTLIGHSYRTLLWDTLVGHS